MPDYGSTSQRDDAAAQHLLKETERIKSIMGSNMDQALRNTERLPDVHRRASLLRDKAKKFHGKSLTLQRKLWCSNNRFKLVLVFTLLLSLTIAAMALYAG